MKELSRLEMSAALQDELKSIDGAINEQIQKFVDNIQAQRNAAVSALLKGYLLDKEHPKDANVKIEDNFIIFYGNTDVVEK